MPIVTLNRRALDLLAGHAVFHQPFAGERWRVGARLAFADDLALEPQTHIFAGHTLPAAMGAFSYSHSTLAHYVRVGRYCSIGVGVAWTQGDHPLAWVTTSPFAYQNDGALQGLRAYPAARPFAAIPAAPLEIGHDVWIGDQAMIRRGVSIGHGAVIGARALVLEDVPPYAIAVGAPARVIRRRFSDALVERLLALAWWRYPPDVLQGLPLEDPERFVDTDLSPTATYVPPVLRAPDLLAAAAAD